MNHRYRFELILAIIFFTLFSAVWAWQNPGTFGGRATQTEIDGYVAALQSAQIPEPERTEMITRVRTWLAEDDGKPVYMLNLMRFYKELRRFPGGPTTGTPQEANKHYEDAAIPILLKHGGYPQYAGMTQGANVIEHRSELDNWDRVLIVRYPSRRAVMEVFTDPHFLAVVGNKLAALSVVLTPTSAEIRIPELSWLLGAMLLISWVGIGWFRASRSPPPANLQ